MCFRRFSHCQRDDGDGNLLNAIISIRSREQRRLCPYDMADWSSTDALWVRRHLRLLMTV